MCQERLNDLAILSVENELAGPINFHELLTHLLQERLEKFLIH